MKDKTRKKSRIIVIAISVLLIVLMLISQAGGGIYKLFASPFTVIQEGVSSIGRSVKNGVYMLFHGDEISEELYNLKQENSAMNSTQIENEILKRENEELKSMVDFKEKYGEFNIIGCEIIAGDTEELNNTYTINCGTSDGISEGSFVVTGDGLAGIVETAGPVSSKVISIVDGQNKLMARTLEKNEMVRVQGRYDDKGSYLIVDRFTEDSEISVGDTLVTSSSGELYPYGIKIGVITEIKVNESSGELYAVAEPAVNLARTTKVFVMSLQKEASDIIPEASPDE